MTYRRWIRIALGYLAFVSLEVGIWAQFAPRSFYDDFPGLGRAWVRVDGPFNEHLVRDVGGLNLALAAAVLAIAHRGEPAPVESVQPDRAPVGRYVVRLFLAGAFVTGLQGFHEPPRGFAIERPRVIHERGRQANAGGQRQPLRQPVIEPVDGLHVQPRRVAVEVPAARTTLRQRGRGQGMQFLPVGGRTRRERQGCVGKRAHDTVPHLGCRLARERDGDNFLRTVHGGEQPQVAERQQAGLAGTRGGLDDEGTTRVDGFAPRVGVAWSLDDASRTVVRASTGIMYEPPLGAFYEDALLESGSPRLLTASVSERRQISVIQMTGTAHSCQGLGPSRRFLPFGCM